MQMFSWKNQKLEVYILIVFLCLIAISMAITVTFTYERNYKSIRDFSIGTVDRASSLIVQKVHCLLSDLLITPKISVGLVKRNPNISIHNKVLLEHLLDEVRYRPSLYGFHAADPEGNYLASLDIKVSGRPSEEKKMPKETQFLVAYVNAELNPPKETWYYYDKNEKLIGKEEIPNRFFDPRARPWYQGAVKAKEPFWAHIFKLSLTEKLGIDVSLPVYDDQNKLLAVIGTSLTMDSFSKFLREQKIGNTGRAFILNAAGKLILPVGKTDHEDVVPVAYKQFLKDRKDNFIVKFDREKYLVATDRFPTTFGQDWQIVIVVPFSDYFGEIIKTRHQTVLISIFILIIAGFLAVFFSKRTSKPIVQLANEVNKIKQLNFDSDVRVKSHIREIILLDSSIASMRNALRSFTRYVPKEIVNKLIEMGHEIELGGEKREITLFFSDISGFTTVSESIPLETLNHLLADYFEGVTKAILKELGTIDKYMGDGVMAFWNAPDDRPDHAIKGCIAALACQGFFSEFNKRQRDAGKPELHTRIGLNTGEMIVGNIGTTSRMNYTVIGDAVNITQRIQDKNKEFQTKIIISEEVVKNTQDQFLVRPLDLSRLKGKKGRIQIYELIIKKDKASREQIEMVNLYTKAYEAFHTGKLSEAKGLFEEFLKQFPEDAVGKIYLERITAG